jgi:hypothetical protein
VGDNSTSIILGEIRASVDRLVDGDAEAKRVLQQRFDALQQSIDKLQQGLGDHDSTAGGHHDAVDQAAVEMYSKVTANNELLKQLLNRREYWRPVVHTLVTGLFKVAPITGAVWAFLIYILSRLTELGALVDGFR